MINKGRKRKVLTLDFHSLPVEVHGHQAGSAAGDWNRFRRKLQRYEWSPG